MPASQSRRAAFTALILVSLALGAPNRGEGAGASGLRKTPVVMAVQKAQASVVNISSEKKANSTSRWPLSNEESARPRVNGMGSGVIVDARGYILTNQHVVDKVQAIDVHLYDGSSHLARVIQQDKELDLALIKIDAGHPVQAVAIGTSSDLMVGETVITIGNAFGYESTVSVGIISQLKRNVTLADEQVYRNLIQTDACINPGNSGGPLINIEGELIGINVATRSGAQGIGFALPIDEVKRVATDMLSTRRIAGTWHGMIAAEAWVGDDRMVVLQEVQPGSPAAEIGLASGDQIIKIGDLAVTNTLDVERALLDWQPGTPVRVSYVRSGKPAELALELKTAGRSNVATNDPGEILWRTLGVRLFPVGADRVAKASSTPLNGGLFVDLVTPNSPAARANIQRGDILVGVNVGENHWATVRPETVVYTLRQPEVSQSQVLPFYIVRRNNIHRGQMSLAETATADRGAARR